MNGNPDDYGPLWGDEVERLFCDGVAEARARSVAPEAVELMLERLGFTKVESSAKGDLFTNAMGRPVLIPTDRPVGMAALVSALRAAAGMDDAAA